MTIVPLTSGRARVAAGAARALGVVLVAMTIASSTSVLSTAAFVISDLVTTVVPKSITGHTRPVADLDQIVQSQIGSILTIRLDVHNNYSRNKNNKDDKEHSDDDVRRSNHSNKPVVGMSVDGLSIRLDPLVAMPPPRPTTPAQQPSSSSSSSSPSSTKKTKTAKKKSTTSAAFLPGAHGPFPAVSSGVHQLNLIDAGKFIDMRGTVKLPFQQDHESKESDDSDSRPSARASSSAWEIVWRENGVNGYLICCLGQLSECVHRSNNPYASLPDHVPLYISFPLWKRKDLTHYQGRKQEVLEKAAEYMHVRDDELHKMQQTTNLFQKAVHYRNAAAAVEKHSLYPVHTMSTKVPNDNEVLPIHYYGGTDDLDNDDSSSSLLLLAKVGTIWTRSNSPVSTSTLLEMALMGPVMKKQDLLGTAVIRSRTIEASVSSADDEEELLSMASTTPASVVGGNATTAVVSEEEEIVSIG